MVEGARLESVYTGNCIASSNLAVSANKKRASYAGSLFIRPCSPALLLTLKFPFGRCPEANRELFSPQILPPRGRGGLDEQTIPCVRTIFFIRFTKNMFTPQSPSSFPHHTVHNTRRGVNRAHPSHCFGWRGLIAPGYCTSTYVYPFYF